MPRCSALPGAVLQEGFSAILQGVCGVHVPHGGHLSGVGAGTGTSCTARAAVSPLPRVVHGQELL